MGLDMYLRKVRRLNENELNNLKNKTALQIENIEDHEYRVVEISENVNESLKYIMDYINIIPAVVPRVNESQIKKDFNIPEIARSGGWSIRSEGIEIYYYDNKNNKFKVKMDWDKYDSYKYEETVDCYVYESIEVAYWRKAYDLQDMIHDSIYMESGREIDNCQYVPVDGKTLTRIRRADSSGQKIYMTRKKDEVLTYYEWY